MTKSDARRTYRPGWRVASACGMAAVGSIAVLSGCETVAPAGATGISVDAEGRPVVVFALCHDHIDGATIYRDRTAADPEDEDNSSVRAGEWDAVSPVTPDTAKNANLNTANPSASWRRVRPLEPLRPGVRYVAFGWTRDNSWYTGHVEFTPERLATLTPGQVLTQTLTESNDRFEDRVQSYSQFTTDACT